MIFTLILGIFIAFVRSQQGFYPINPKFLHPGNSRFIDVPQQVGLIYFGSSQRGNPWYPDHPQRWQVLSDMDDKISVKSSLQNNEQTPRFLLNPYAFSNNAMAGYNTAVGPLLFRTYLYTSVLTSTIQSVSLCIPAAQFSAGAGATSCARRRREIAEFLDNLTFLDDGEPQSTEVKPSPVDKVEVTAMKSIHDNQHVISSSKEEMQTGIAEPISDRIKRFFNIFAPTKTITSYSFVTEIVRKQVSIVAQSAGAAAVNCGGAARFSCLVCVPPGYGVC